MGGAIVRRRQGDDWIPKSDYRGGPWYPCTLHRASRKHVCQACAENILRGEWHAARNLGLAEWEHFCLGCVVLLEEARA